jgi:hypothetical protein
MAFFTIGLFSCFIYKNSPLPFFSLFLLLGTFLYPTIMGQYRQALALAIVAFASSYKDEKIIFIVLIFLASFFHVSSLLALLLIFIPDRLFKGQIYFFFLLLALLANQFLILLFSEYINSFPDFISRKLGIYSDSEKGQILGFNMAMILRIIIFFFFWKGRIIIQKYKNGSFFLNIYFLSLLIYLGLGFLPQLGGRGSLYFYVFELILAAMLITKTQKYKYYILVFFFVVSVYRQISFFNQWGEDYIPYSSDLRYLFGL